MSYRLAMRKFFDNFIKIFPNSYLEEMFYRLGRRLGVRSFTCEKDLGLFEGDINDQTVHRFFLRHGTWAPGLQYILTTLFADGSGTFLDIGANIGLTAIPLAKKNEQINIYAFEPEPNNYNMLRKNLIANGLEARIKTFNVALFSEDGTLDMELSKDNMGDHRVRRQTAANLQNNFYAEASRPTVKIQARRLDSLLKVQDLSKPIILKVDTQGAEVQVFCGATAILKEVDYLIVEYWPYGLQRMGDTPDSFLRIIKQFPYGGVYDDDVRAMPQLSPLGEFIAHIDASLPKSGTGHLDILLSRQSSFKECQDVKINSNET
jgi:FkbM family methyltransferase